MKYQVRYQCGHDGEVELYGKNSEREKKLAWYATSLCPECYKSYRTREGASASAKYNLPALEGTQKQIDYANRLRGDFILDDTNCKKMETGLAFVKYLSDEDVIAEIATKGTTVSEVIANAKRQQPKLYAAYVILTDSSAKTVIEAVLEAEGKL